MTPGFFQITQKVFLIRGDDFLVLRDRKTQFGDLPGGRLAANEIYEPLEHAIAREMREELGNVDYRLQAEPAFLFPHRIQDGGHPALGIAYIAKYLGGDPTLSDEHDWMSWANIREYDPRPLFCEHMLDAVLRFQSSLHLARSIASSE